MKYKEVSLMEEFFFPDWFSPALASTNRNCHSVMTWFKSTCELYITPHLLKIWWTKWNQTSNAFQWYFKYLKVCGLLRDGTGGIILGYWRKTNSGELLQNKVCWLVKHEPLSIYIEHVICEIILWDFLIK